MAPKRRQDEPEGIPWDKQPEDLDIDLPGADVHLGRLRWEKSKTDGSGRMEMPDLSTASNDEKHEIASRMAKFRVRRENAKAKTGTLLSEDTFRDPGGMEKFERSDKGTRSEAAKKLQKGSR